MPNEAAPRTPPEATSVILEAIRGVLGDPTVAADDDFFSVGGDSILAAAVVRELQRVTGVEVPIAYFFSYPTAEEFGEAFVELPEPADEHAAAD